MIDSHLTAKLPHLKHYPCYLPHIGKNYSEAKTKILIIGESHYLDEDHDNAFPADVWYNKPELVKSSNIDFGWCNTRKVVDWYLTRYHENTLGRKFGFFRNLNAVYTAFASGNNLFEDGAYINYYQRPSQTQGKTIKVHNFDRSVGYQNLSAVCEVIRPDVVVFASKKAHNDFKKSHRELQNEFIPQVHQVPHPSSAHWNKASKNYGLNDDGSYATGKQKFQNILKTIYK